MAHKILTEAFVPFTAEDLNSLQVLAYQLEGLEDEKWCQATMSPFFPAPV